MPIKLAKCEHNQMCLKLLLAMTSTILLDYVSNIYLKSISDQSWNAVYYPELLFSVHYCTDM